MLSTQTHFTGFKRPGRRAVVLAVTAVLWAVAVAVGLGTLWDYEITPASAGRASPHWPETSGIVRDRSRPTLVVFVHPHCPCSRASIRELARLMARVPERVSGSVLFVRPAHAPPNWAESDLWHTAVSIRGVRASVIDDARARAFGARVSGETLLYAADGRLLFAGGLTGSRGHEGDNVGRDTVTRLLMQNTHAETTLASSFVFGCFLMDAPSE